MSIFLNTGKILSFLLFFSIDLTELLVNSAILLSENPIDFIKENIYYLYGVCWIILAKNKNYNARLLVQNNYQEFKKNNDFWNDLHYINNETSLYLFNKYRSKIDLNKISSNPIIFDYNYKNIKDSKKIINQEVKRKYYYLDKQKYINYYNCNIILSYL